MTDAAALAHVLAEMQRRGIGAPAKSVRYCPHEPFPQQSEFLSLDCLEAMYGGAAGGGKSDALLMAALQYVHVPGYAALLLRRTYKDLALPGAIMDRAKEWFSNTEVKWHDNDKRWQFPSGASLTFGYLDNDSDRYRYQGAELQFIGFDELTQFPEAWYRYLLSRLRRKSGVEVPLRARSATNPGGIGHEWVKRRFVDEGRVGPFIPARLDDNIHLDRESYRASLDALDPVQRAQLLDGIWVRDSGGLVYSAFSPDLCHVAQVSHDAKWRYVLGMDFGYNDDCAFVILGWPRYSRTVYVLESFKQDKLLPPDCADVVKALMTRYRFDRMVGDIGGLGKPYVETMRQRFGIPVEPADKVNKRGYIDLVNGAWSRRELMVVGDANRELTKELVELPWDAARLKEAGGFPNHLADALLYGWRAATAWLEPDAPAAVTLEMAEDLRIKRIEQNMAKQKPGQMSLRKRF